MIVRICPRSARRRWRASRSPAAATTITARCRAGSRPIPSSSAPTSRAASKSLKVREGDHVDKGDLLFGLDDDLQKADVVVRQAAVANAQQTFDRATELLKSAAGTQKALDDAWAALRQAKANLEWSQTRLARRRSVEPGRRHHPGGLLPAGRDRAAGQAGDRAAAARQYQDPLLRAGNRARRASRSARRSRSRCDACATGLTAKVSFIARSAEYTPPVIYSREERAKLVYLIEARPGRSGQIPRRPAGDGHAAAGRGA